MWMIEVKFQGRGGQGAVTASEILGRSFFLEGWYPQAFSLFGGERRGAPVFGFLRVDDKPILLKCAIKNPDHVVIFDLSLADEQEILRELKPGGSVLINTKLGIDHFPQYRKVRVGLVNATGIAKGEGVGDNFNTAILGAYVRLTGLIHLETLTSVVRKMVPAKADLNVLAVQRAYQETTMHMPEETN
jgi:2-oxoacid:acceptor oxidoreductase gamma subunit (pyruvate/2-ketoisovalerate family)